MTVLDLLATSRNRQDEQPNQELADEIIRSNRMDWIDELVKKPSVITTDHVVGILAQLSCFQEYTEITFPLLLEQLRICPAKQLPMYTEKSLKAITGSNREQFNNLIIMRIPEMEKDSQWKRLIKVLNKIKNI